MSRATPTPLTPEHTRANTVWPLTHAVASATKPATANACTIISIAPDD